MPIKDPKEEKKTAQDAIALVSNLARCLGKRNSSGLVYTWKYDGLAVVVDDDEHFTIAMYHDGVVCSNIIVDDPIYVEGKWLDIVNGLRDQVKGYQLCSGWEKVRECTIGPLVEA